METQEANEDEEGINEPAEVADFLKELGEGDHRCLILKALLLVYVYVCV